MTRECTAHPNSCLDADGSCVTCLRSSLSAAEKELAGLRLVHPASGGSSCARAEADRKRLREENDALRSELASLKRLERQVNWFDPRTHHGEWKPEDLTLVPGDPNAKHWMLQGEIQQVSEKAICTICGHGPMEHYLSSALKAPADRFDPTTLCDAHEPGGGFTGMRCVCRSLRAAFLRGWQSAPENDRAQTERLFAKVKDQGAEIERLRGALLLSACPDCSKDYPRDNGFGPCGYAFHAQRDAALAQAGKVGGK